MYIGVPSFTEPCQDTGADSDEPRMAPGLSRATVFSGSRIWGLGFRIQGLRLFRSLRV